MFDGSVMAILRLKTTHSADRPGFVNGFLGYVAESPAPGGRVSSDQSRFARETHGNREIERSRGGRPPPPNAQGRLVPARFGFDRFRLAYSACFAGNLPWRRPGAPTREDLRSLAPMPQIHVAPLDRAGDFVNIPFSRSC